MSAPKKYRLITRCDFDGLICALLLMHKEILNDVLFVHPKDMQDGKVEVNENCVSTNLPYTEGIHLAFDHHLSETLRVGPKANHIIDPDAPSAARVVYNYYGGKPSFPSISTDMMEAVDRADSAQFNIEEVLNPKGWAMLNFIMDARTGLGRFQEFRISNYQLMLDLTLQTGIYSIEQILELPDVKERVDLYNHYRPLAYDQIRKVGKSYNNVVVLDLRNEQTIYPTNRFMIYALYPECNISIHAMWGKDKANTVFAIGKSIFKKDSTANIGSICLEYGGGGHRNAGTCQVDHDQAETTLAQLIERIKETE